MRELFDLERAIAALGEWMRLRGNPVDPRHEFYFWVSEHAAQSGELLLVAVGTRNDRPVMTWDGKEWAVTARLK